MLWPYRLTIDSSRKGSGSCFVERALTGVSLAVIGKEVFEKRGKWRFLGSTGRRTALCVVLWLCVPSQQAHAPLWNASLYIFMSVFYSCSNISFERNGPWWYICAWFWTSVLSWNYGSSFKYWELQLVLCSPCADSPCNNNDLWASVYGNGDQGTPHSHSDKMSIFNRP